jgi:hypothetical protein
LVLKYADGGSLIGGTREKPVSDTPDAYNKLYTDFNKVKVHYLS